jgi:membrane protease subunit HflC
VNSLVRILIALLVVLGILAFMTTYTVRFTEKAVLTTFGRVSEGSVKTEPGMGFKWPYPIQSVIKYDTRLRFVETRSETTQTADQKQVILSIFVTWRVSDPLKFFQTYGAQGSRAIDHFRAADQAMTGRLRTAGAQTSNYKLGELLGIDGSGRLQALEQSILTSLRSDSSGKSLADQGIEAVAVGVSSLRLPESTTREVIERMKSTRVALATTAASQGNALANKIKNEAEQQAKTILAFAERRAQAIRSQGEREAGRYYETMKENSELAVFQRSLEFMRGMATRQTTLILSPQTVGLGLFNPDVLKNMSAGQIPPAAAPAPEPKPAGRAGAAAPAGPDVAVVTPGAQNGGGK